MKFLDRFIKVVSSEEKLYVLGVSHAIDKNQNEVT
jgi:hypothetical protein